MPLHFIIVFIQEAKDIDTGLVQTQENEFSFSQEEARTTSFPFESPTQLSVSTPKFIFYISYEIELILHTHQFFSK